MSRREQIALVMHNFNFVRAAAIIGKPQSLDLLKRTAQRVLTDAFDVGSIKIGPLLAIHDPANNCLELYLVPVCSQYQFDEEAE